MGKSSSVFDRVIRSYFHFRKITSVSVNGYSRHMVSAVVLNESG